MTSCLSLLTTNLFKVHVCIYLEMLCHDTSIGAENCESLSEFFDILHLNEPSENILLT